MAPRAPPRDEALRESSELNRLQETPELLRQGPDGDAWLWQSRGLNELADALGGDDDDEDFVRITRIINGGTLGLAERREYWARARRTLGIA